MTKIEKLREINKTLNNLLIDLETRIFVEKSNDKREMKKNKVMLAKSSIYK